jgi:hypothetical protein
MGGYFILLKLFKQQERMDSVKKEPSWKAEGSKKLRDCVPDKPQDTAVAILSQVSNLGNSELYSKDCVDRVESINDKPSVEAEGENKLRDWPPESTIDSDSHIVAHGRFSRKQEIDMSEQGFIKVPRSLLNDPRWNGMRLKYRHVFLILLARCYWKKTKYNVRGNIIELEKGQICVSYRQLVDWCNQEMSFKEDYVDKNIVERAVSVFFQFQIARHEVRHGKMVITITIPGYYGEEKNETETLSETKPRHNRDIKEEVYKKNKKDKKETREPEKVDAAPVGRLVEFLNLEILKIKPNFSKKETPSWQKGFSSLLKLRSEDELMKIIMWALSHEFWSSNVFSPGAILRNLDKMEMQMTKIKDNKWKKNTTNSYANSNQGSSESSTCERPYRTQKSYDPMPEGFWNG